MYQEMNCCFLFELKFTHTFYKSIVFFYKKQRTFDQKDNLEEIHRTGNLSVMMMVAVIFLKNCKVFKFFEKGKIR